MELYNKHKDGNLIVLGINVFDQEKKFKTAEEKIAWVCENFDGAEERLEPVKKEGAEC